MDNRKKGLEDVIAVETKIAYIDGIKGILAYRGINVADLMDYSYEEVSHLLLKGYLPDESELSDYITTLRNERELDSGVIDILRICNKQADAMDVLRTAVSYISQYDADYNDNSVDANTRKAVKMIAKFPTIVAAFYRIINGLEPVSPDSELGHGANFLYMLKGTRPTELEAEIMEKDLILSAEHGLNASTFASRITASTLSDIHSAIISGICTLKGPLHGGARLGAMNMLDEIGSIDNVENFVEECIIAKKELQVLVTGFTRPMTQGPEYIAILQKNFRMKMPKMDGMRLQRDLRMWSTGNLLKKVQKSFIQMLIFMLLLPISI